MGHDKDYLVNTSDGTSTLFLGEYNEAMHSDSGAYEEALLKHIYPSNILERDYEILNALDIGFGLGYNVLALIYEFKKRKLNKKLNIISLEKNNDLLPFMEKISFNDDRDLLYAFIRQAYGSGYFSQENIEIKIFFDDARRIFPNFRNMKFDAIFQDPFSPAKNPEMWTVDYFKVLYSLLKEDGVLTTYSSAIHVRRAMVEAGFFVAPGPSVGRKREGTLAFKKENASTFRKEEIEEIFSAIKSEPYRDENFSLKREEILERRLLNIRLKKNSL